MSHLTEQQQLVQALVEAAGGLVDGGDDGTPSRGPLPQDLHTVHGCCRIQTCTVQEVCQKEWVLGLADKYSAPLPCYSI